MLFIDYFHVVEVEIEVLIYWLQGARYFNVVFKL